jgi:hypothetical protein
VLVEVLDLALVPALEEFEVLSGLQTPCYWLLGDEEKENENRVHNCTAQLFLIWSDKYAEVCYII